MRTRQLCHFARPRRRHPVTERIEIRLNLSMNRVEAIEAQRVRDVTCWPFPIVLIDKVSTKVVDRQMGYQVGEVCA